MPEIGGVELAEHLHASGRRVPTVFVTAHETEDLRSRARLGSREEIPARPPQGRKTSPPRKFHCQIGIPPPTVTPAPPPPT